MVNNTIHATYVETYDINTIQNELSILAIHTPQSKTLKKFFHGFYEQYSKMKVLGCNFKIACASKQDLDPTLVGFEEGQIDPRDVMNPLLFKACTGEGINALLDQIYNSSEDITPQIGDAAGHSIDQHIDTSTSAIKAYYSLLADGSFRKAHPQAGMTIMGLKPMVHKIVSTQPFKWSVAGGSGDIPRITPGGTVPATGQTQGFGGESGSKVDTTDPVNYSVFVSNGLTDMPWLDTAFSKVHNFPAIGTTPEKNVKAYGLQQNIPRVYMGALILPPSSGSQNLFFRISVVWHILFKDFRMAQDLMPVSATGLFDADSDSNEFHGLDEQNGYFNMYHTASKLEKDYGSFDTQGVESVSEVLQKGM